MRGEMKSLGPVKGTPFQNSITLSVIIYNNGYITEFSLHDISYEDLKY